MTGHDKEFQALARRIKDLRHDIEPTSWWLDYVSLTVVVLLLLLFDTETWFQRLLLLILGAAAALLLWFGRRSERK